MKVSNPILNPWSLIYDAVTIGKKAVDDYGKRMMKGEGQALEQLDIEFKANVDNVGDCVNDCIAQDKGGDCMDRCNVPYTEKFYDKMDEQKEIFKWPGRWFFENQGK